MTRLDHDVAERADRNFVVHVTWAPERTSGMSTVVGDDLVIADSGLPCDTFNFVCRARLERGVARKRVDSARDYYESRRRPFSWWVGPADRPRDLGQVLADAGLEAAEGELAMAMRLADLPDAVPPVQGFEVRRVEGAAELEVFARLSAANWTPPDDDVVTFYDSAAAALLAGDSPQLLYVGYLQGEPVATAEATVADGTAGLYNISTLPAYRGRGIGSLMTWTPLHLARAGGCDLGVLQAAPDGVKLYRRLGFAPFGQITEYKPRARTRAAEEAI